MDEILARRAWEGCVSHTRPWEECAKRLRAFADAEALGGADRERLVDAIIALMHTAADAGDAQANHDRWYAMAHRPFFEDALFDD